MRKLILVLVMFIMMNTMVNVVNPYTTVAKDFEQRKRLELPSIIGLAESEIEKTQLEERIKKLEEYREDLRKQKEEQERKRLEEEKKRKEKLEREKKEKEKATRGSSRNLYTVTCYDLSVKSTGKPIGHKAYGITSSGINLTGHTWKSARAIAVDPKKIPLGSTVKITFVDERYSKYNGEYVAVDTGGAIKENKIDFFMGDFNQNETHPSVWEFGRTKATVEVIKYPN